MHELGVTRTVVGLAVQRAAEQGFHSVLQVRLRVGESRGYDPEWVRRYFAMVAEGTPAQGAELVLDVVPARFACTACGAGFHLGFGDDPGGACPRCGGRDYVRRAGDELVLSGLEVS